MGNQKTEEERSLTRQRHAEEQARVQAFLSEFRSESDRAVVILSAAKVDQLLGELLEVTLLPVTGSRDELLDSDGPLATFSSRIAITTRMGLIAPELARALQLVRKIRNAFAHEVTGCNLQSGAQSDRTRQLAAQVASHPAYANARALSADGHEGLSADFRACMALLIAALTLGIRNAKRLAVTTVTLEM